MCRAVEVRHFDPKSKMLSVFSRLLSGGSDLWIYVCNNITLDSELGIGNMYGECNACNVPGALHVTPAKC